MFQRVLLRWSVSALAVGERASQRGTSFREGRGSLSLAVQGVSLRFTPGYGRYALRARTIELSLVRPVPGQTSENIFLPGIPAKAGRLWDWGRLDPLAGPASLFRVNKIFFCESLRNNPERISHLELCAASVSSGQGQFWNGPPRRGPFLGIWYKEFRRKHGLRVDFGIPARRQI